MARSVRPSCDRGLCAGAEASIRLGIALGAGHYGRGFHQTATAGAFGATLAAGHLLGLERDGLRRAPGICATRASGLKSQFGTMGKAYNAGIAASNGVECALLALRGMSAPDDGIGGPQGLLPTHADAVSQTEAFSVPPEQTFLLVETRHKLHACCHGTHAMIEALRTLCRHPGLAPDEIAEIRLKTAPRGRNVCAISRPRTGLEARFSYAWLAALVITGRDTAAEHSFAGALVMDAGLARLAACVSVRGDPGLTDMQAQGVLRLASGRELPFSHGLAAVLPHEALGAALLGKARALLGPLADTLWQDVQGLGSLSARALGRRLSAAGEAA